MQVIPTSLDDVLVLEPAVIDDERGFFSEVWSLRGFRDATGFQAEFVQDNQSGSKQNVLRGLHYQLPPHAQGKLVRAVVGSVFDVAVDLRRSSPTFGEWHGVELTSDNRRQLWVPPGFAHGFLSTSAWAEIHYKVTDYYARESERAVRWDDPDIDIDWPFDGSPIVSDRDRSAPGLHEAEVFS